MSDEKAFDAELAREMVDEARESLDSVVPQLLILRARPEDPEPIKKVFRTFHTIKGNAGMVGLEGIAEFAHRAETALNLLREGERSVTDERISLFVEAVDLLAFLFDALDYEAGREGGDGSELDFLERLESAFAEDADPEMSVCVKLSDWLDEVGCDDVLADHPRVAELAAWFERYAPPPEIVEEALQGATPETCNAVDDDCDGVVDEAAGDVGAACGAGQGLCRRDRSNRPVALPRSSVDRRRTRRQASHRRTRRQMLRP